MSRQIEFPGFEGEERKPNGEDSAWSAWCDGASRGNPGPASYGVVVCDPSGKVAAEVSEYLGKNTNQVAEYEALIRALKELLARGARRANIFTDSEFVTKQFTGQYRVKDERMKALLSRVRALEEKLGPVRVTHIARSSHPHNVRADALANEALDHFTVAAGPLRQRRAERKVRASWPRR